MWLGLQTFTSDSFCFLINSSWLLAFILYVFSLFSSGFNLYWWKGIHFSQNLDLLVLHLFFGFLINFWYRDLLREFYKKYEVLLIMFFLLFLLFLVSEGLLFVSFFWISFHSLCSPTLGICLREGFYLPDPCELKLIIKMNEITGLLQHFLQDFIDYQNLYFHYSLIFLEISIIY